MIDYLDVIVLQDARAVRDNLSQELAKRGFAVRSCGSLAGLRHLYATQPAPLVVLTGDSDDLACDAQSARMAAPSAVIIALGAAADTAWRTHVMAAGADACHAASIDIAELTAILLAWGRRAMRGSGVESLANAREFCRSLSLTQHHPVSDPIADSAGHPHLSPPVEPAGGDTAPALCHAGYAVTPPEVPVDTAVAASHPMGHAVSGAAARMSGDTAPPHPRHDPSVPAPPPGRRSGRLGSGWRLDANCRVLACPRDRTLIVTAAENSFLMRIAACEGQLLRRQRTPPPIVEDHDRGDPPMDPRSMDVLVSRLRRKARQAGIELPLLAVRGCGYLFAECLTVTPSSVAPRAAASSRTSNRRRAASGHPYTAGNFTLHVTTSAETLTPAAASSPILEDSARMYRRYGLAADSHHDFSVHEDAFQLLAA
ncbi:OmpR/PhoB-type domain-containing protein [Bordetella sputigena]|uniref:helix-turn-helix domain-containing protein n=1 Tax=Bordetella sputigena TaxID=1416810 RepID=UPI0039F0B4F9